MKVSATLITLLSLLIAGTPCSATPSASDAPAPAMSIDDPISGFEQRVEMIPMRDGVQLYTEIYSPKARAGELPIIMVRTPYGVTRMTKSGGKGSVFARGYRELAQDGYIFIFQDIRGRQNSHGEFVMLRPPRAANDRSAVDESTDAYDTIEWALRNVGGSNGRVGMMGISYPAWLTMMATLDPHPALRAVSPQASPADVYVGDDFFHNGAFRLSYGFEYVALMQRGAGNNLFQFDAYDSYDWYLRLGGLSGVEQRYFRGHETAWRDFVSHPNYDSFWRARAVLPRLLGPVRIPALTVGGWFDQEDGYGPPTIYSHWRRNDPQGQSHLVLGPWNHGGWSEGEGRTLGEIDFGSDTAAFFRRDVLVPWFAYYLKDKRGPKPARALVFETGANVWHRMDDWPPNEGIRETKLYLREGGKLAFEPAVQPREAFDEYVSDPARPVPYRARPIESTFGFLKGGKDGWEDWLVADQRFVHSRPDVLSWVTEPLDRDLVLAGNAGAELYASTTGTDADWIVKLIDVYPDQYPDKPELGGYQLMVTADAIRGRFRNSRERPQPISPGAVERYDVDLHQRLHRFRRGHRIMVQVQSTWFPLYDRNPQKFVDNIFTARDQDFEAATQRVYRSNRFPSHVRMSIKE